MVYDPLAMDNARKGLGSSVLYADSLDQCIQLADLLIIASPDREFRRDVPYVALRVGKCSSDLTAHLECLWSQAARSAV